MAGDDDASVDPEYAPFYNALTAADIPLVIDPFSAIEHNKFAVIDDLVTWTGSANLSNTSFTFNMDNSVVFTDTYIALPYSMEFEEMFSGSFSNQKTYNTPHVFTYTNAVIEIYFSPTDNVKQQVLEALYFQYFELVNLLNLGDSKIATTVIGTSFDWKDLVAYTIGFILIFIWISFLQSIGDRTGQR